HPARLRVPPAVRVCARRLPAPCSRARGEERTRARVSRRPVRRRMTALELTDVLVGESGGGKSTFARAAVGLVRMTSASVVFEGRDIVPLARRGRPRDLARLQLVFQNPYASLNPR